MIFDPFEANLGDYEASTLLISFLALFQPPHSTCSISIREKLLPGVQSKDSSDNQLMAIDYMSF